MPLQPSRRDTASLPAVVRHHQSYLRSLNPGMGDGRWATPQPVGVGPSPLVGGEEGGSDESPAVIGEDGDRLTLTHLRDQVWPLQYDPISETIHVHWHPGAGAGVEWKRGEHYEIDDDSNVVVIRAATLAAAHAEVGDVFSAQYLRLDVDDGPDELDFSVVGYTAPGVWDAVSTVTFDLPDGTAEGDLLLLTSRGPVAPGGGEVLDGLSCSDPRMTEVFAATAVNGSKVVVEKIWVGVATGSAAPVVIDVDDDPGLTPSGRGVLGAFRGANGWGVVSASEVTDGTTPQIDGVAAVAVTWLRGPVPTSAAEPDGYTFGTSSGLDYSSTAIGHWYDLTGTTSPAGAYVGEGCCVIAIV
jgi:hypothetical protein